MVGVGASSSGFDPRTQKRRLITVTCVRGIAHCHYHALICETGEGGSGDYTNLPSDIITISITSETPVLVLITGPPCTGKTTLGNRLASDFGLPFFFKDGFKERMYDDYADVHGMGSVTRDVSHLLGRMSMGCLQIVCEEMLARGRSHILEANFDSTLFSPYLAQLRTHYAFHSVQIQLKAEGETLLERFIRRETEDRHPGHQGLAFMESVKPALLRGEQEPLHVAGDLLTLDTTDFARLDYARIHALLAGRLGRTPGQV